MTDDVRRAGGVRDARSLFQATGGGSTPTSALDLWFDAVPLAAAKRLNRLWHSRLPVFGRPTCRVAYAAESGGLYYAAAIWTNPLSRNLPQRRWLELNRMAVAPDAPRNTASRMLAWMARDIRKRLPDVARLISYQDVEAHTGGIYRAARWTATKRSDGGEWASVTKDRRQVVCGGPKQRWEKVMASGIKWTELDPPERKRTYLFPGGERVTFENVVRVEVRESGKHRVETADGRKAFVCPGWLVMEIDTAEWTF